MTGNRNAPGVAAGGIPNNMITGGRSTDDSTPLVPAVAAFVGTLGAEIIDADDIGAHAAEYAATGWRVFPLRGKVPAIRGGRGLLDATADVARVSAWWDRDYRDANIGLRPPDNVIVIDVDPRHGGDRSLAALIESHGPLPPTLTCLSGRRDGGCHLYWRRPFGKVTARKLGPGIDLKNSRGYVVVPPSLHPDTRQPYIWLPAPVADPPAWLVDLLVEDRTPKAERSGTGASPDRVVALPSSSIADEFTAATTWAQILGPHGWHVVKGDGEEDQSAWRHPEATSPSSATIRHGVLFVYTTSTAFEPTEAAAPCGYTRFRAWAVLNHGGDLSAAARAFRLTGEV